MGTDAKKEEARQQGIEQLDKLSREKPGIFQKVSEYLFGSASDKRPSKDR